MICRQGGRQIFAEDGDLLFRERGSPAERLGFRKQIYTRPPLALFDLSQFVLNDFSLLEGFRRGGEGAAQQDLLRRG